MKRVILGATFTFVTLLEPERDPSGAIRTFEPQNRYRNVRKLPLHRFGSGSFCHFGISRDLTMEGVYLLDAKAEIVYVGECVNLAQRFNSGYGAISPRNCYVGGQPTNCRINKLIMREAQKGNEIALWFCETADRKRLEERLIRELDPEWNVQLRG